MQLKETGYILAISRYGSVTKAAEALYITQPALSKYLKNMERQIGAPLFHRMGNELVPTEIGRRYLAYAAQIDAIHSDWETECADLVGGKAGSLSIAVPLMRGSCIIPDTLARFYQTYPEVQIVLQEESHSIEKRLISSRRIDFAIYNATSPHPTLVHEELGKEEVVLVMAHDHPLSGRGVQRKGCRYPWMDLALTGEEAFVLHPPEQTTGQISAKLLDRAGIHPRVLLQTRNSDVAIQLAANGTALCFAPESYVGKIHFARPPRVFSVGEPKTETTLYAIYQKGRYMPLYAEHFLELVKSYMAARSFV